MYSGGGNDQRRAYGSRSRSRSPVRRSVSDSRGPPPPPANPRGRGPPPRRQQFSSSPSRSPLPQVTRDAFGRNTAARQRYGEKSSSEEQPRGRESSYSRDRSPKQRRGDGRMPMFPGMPGMFPMGMGGKGMFPMLGMEGWPGAPPGGEPGRSRDGMPPGWPPGMWGPGMPWPWAGFQGAAPPFQDSRRRGGSRDRSRPRSRGQSRSQDRRGDGGDANVKCPRNIMGRVIGKGGNTINDIRQESGARVDAEDVNDDHCMFNIRGPSEAVEKAKSMIEAIIEKVLEQNRRGANRENAGGPPQEAHDSADAITDTLEFPPQMTGKIIGARGAKIAEVRHSSGARVQVEKLEDKCLVQITGKPEQIERAKTMIVAVSEEPPDAPVPDDSGEVQNDFVDYGANATGAIIGTRGARIAEVRQQSGARVQVEKMEDKCRVQLSGTPAQIARAKKIIHRLVEESAMQVNRRAEAEESLEVPASAVGRVIGKGGETIQRVQRETGAHLDVNAKSEPPTVRITGSREAICHARFLINEIVDRGGNRDDRSFSPPRGYWGGPDSSGSGGPWGPGYPPGGFADELQFQPGQWGPWQPPPGMWDPKAGQRGLEDDRGKRSEIDLDEL